MTRLRVIVRADLSPAQQAVQACHAQAQFAHEHSATARAWFETSNTLALLSVPDEASLETMWSQARARGIRSAGFHEPDIGDRLTAICLEPSKEARRLCQGLAPALRDL